MAKVRLDDLMVVLFLRPRREREETSGGWTAIQLCKSLFSRFTFKSSLFIVSCVLSL